MLHVGKMPVLMLATLLLQVSLLVSTQSDYPCTTAASWKQRPCIENHTFFCLRDRKTYRPVVSFPSGENFPLKSMVNVSNVNSLCIFGNGSSITCEGQAAGLSFTNVGNLYLENLTVSNCILSANTASISITSCANVTVKNLVIEGSKRTGLALYNTGDQVTIESCIFQNNGVASWLSESADQLENEGNGGGLQLIIQNLNNGTICISECKFLNNTAVNGGGMFVKFGRKAENNDITIQRSQFINNTALNGGGGLLINTNSACKNILSFQESTFESNIAKYGGGTAILSEFTDWNNLTFSDCTWTKNSAVLGLAMDIGSQRNWLKFEKCTFSENCPLFKSDFIANTPRSVVTVIVSFNVLFSEENLFQDNCGSAIEALTSTLEFTADSSTKFIRNKAVNGGALNLSGRTMMYINQNSRFVFVNNTAENRGGAISVQMQDKHSYFGKEDSCFIKYKDGGTPKNVSFYFGNNFAGLNSESRLDSRSGGHSVYATSLISCLNNCVSTENHTEVHLNETLGCVGHFAFQNISRIQFSTAADHFEEGNAANCRFRYDKNTLIIQINNSQTEPPGYGKVLIIPGKNTTLPLRLVDEFCHEVFFHVSVTVLESKDSSIFVSSTHSVITDNHMTIYGKQRDSGIIQLSTIGTRVISLRIHVTMDSCPPGYVLVDSEKACRCSSINAEESYVGIERCNEENFTAYVKHGYWIGYSSTSPDREKNLCSAICPKGFCWYNAFNHSLPLNSSRESLNNFICRNRTGDICGACKNGTSAAYHSMSFTCKSNDQCHLGWLFYILSELIPVTLFFLVVIYFNISFTSGPLNCIIFFMQVVDTLKIDAENFIQFNEKTLVLMRIHKFTYRIFNLNTFALEELSFRLWANASALDMLAFRYVTILYSLLLVLASILLVRVCDFRKSLTKRIRILNLKRSIIHGLSTFLVMSYSECTRVSLMILTRGTVIVGYNSSEPISKAFYNGEFKYMGLDHLKYALPAIFFIATLVVIPPLLLIAYPLCYKLFALLRIEESKFVQITCKVFPLEKIKPLFDSIQSAFKDQYRFFAGLYFLYRLCLVVTFAYAGTFRMFYSVTGVLLVLFLGGHAVCRPYKKAWHNILDGVLFSNLAIINALSFYNYQLTVKEQTHTKSAAIQQVLILFPLAYLALYMTYHIVLRLKHFCVRKCSREERVVLGDNSDHILDALDSRTLDGVKDTEYMLMKKE